MSDVGGGEQLHPDPALSAAKTDKELPGVAGAADTSAGKEVAPSPFRLDLLVIYLLVVFYALCYQLQSPVEPFLVDKLIGGKAQDKVSGAGAAYGRLQSIFSVVQAFGSLIMGYLLDKAGVRAGFAINFVACALQYYMLYLSNVTESLNMLYLSKLPGVAMAGFLCAQAAVARLTSSGPERVQALGRLTSAYTVGGVFGPYLGGVLGAKGNYELGAKLAAAGSVIAVLLSIFGLPAKVDSSVDKAAEKADDAKGVASKPWAQRAIIVLRVAGVLLAVKVITGSANSMARSAQPLILKDTLGFKEDDMGTFMSCQFAFGGFANAFLLAPLCKMMGGNLDIVVRNCIFFMALGFGVQAFLFAPAVGLLAALPLSVKQYPLIGLTMGMAIFQYSLGTSITAETTSVVPSDYKGTLIGMEHSMFAVAYAVGPAAGVALLGYGGISGLSAACCSVYVLVLTVLVTFGGQLAKGKKG